MRDILTFLLVLLIALPALAGTSIWGSPQRTTLTSIRFPVDISALSSPGHVRLTATSGQYLFDSAGTIAGDTFGTGVPTFLETPSSANLAAAVTDENGSGKLIFSNGTLAIASGKTLTVSNTLTFTGTDSSSVAFGAGGTVLYSGGALGTPSSATLTNA